MRKQKDKPATPPPYKVSTQIVSVGLGLLQSCLFSISWLMEESSDDKLFVLDDGHDSAILVTFSLKT